MNSTSTESIENLAQDASKHAGLTTELKIVICVLAALVINLICLMFFCASKYRQKRSTDARSSTFHDLSRKTFSPNFPTLTIVDSQIGMENSRKSTSRYQDNLKFQGLCPPGGKRIYKGKDGIYQTLLQDV